MPKPKKFREVAQRLREHDPRFEFRQNRGKGSERMIYHPDIGGRSESIPLKCHGEGTEIYSGVLRSIIRRFNLPADIFD